MAVTVEASGTQTATIGTEHSLHSNAGAKVFIFVVNTTNMVNGDVLELRIKSKVLTGSTVALAFLATFQNVQAEPVKMSVPVAGAGFTGGTEFTLKQTAGTGRSYEWAVWSIG